MTNCFVVIIESIDQEGDFSMSDESVPENKPAADKDTQSVVASAWKVMENTEVIAGSNRQIVNGGLIGACLLFLAAMLGVQKLDTPLTIALVAFAIAIPILVYGFLFSTYKAKPVPGWRLLVALQAGAWIIEAFGWLAVAGGVFAILAHLSPLAFKASVVASILVVVLGFTGSFIGLIIYAMHKFRKEQQQKIAKEEAMTTDGAKPE
jgi:hypothetical protein